MKHSTWKVKVSATLVALMAFSACSGNKTSSDAASVNSTASSSAETDANSAAVADTSQNPVSLVTDPYGPLLNTSVSTSTGYYELFLSADATGNNILYTDFQTKQRVYLCNTPGCTHSDDSCTSWFGGISGGSYLFKKPDGSKLYYVQRGMEEDVDAAAHQDAAIYAMNADGSDRKELLRLGGNGRISDAIAADSQSIYLDISMMEDATVGPYKQLWRVNAGDGTHDVLLENIPSLYRLFGAYGNCLVFQDQGDSAYTFYGYDLEKKELNTLYTLPYDTLNGCCIVYDHTLYMLSQQTELQATLTAYDFLTGETATIENVPMYGGDVTNFVGLYDGNYLVYDSTNTTDTSNIQQHRYLVDLSTQTVSELTLTRQNSYEQPITVLGESSNALLVAYGSHTATVQTMYNGQVTQMEVEMAPDLGLIAKSDFYQNVEKYDAIDDTVMSEQLN